MKRVLSIALCSMLVLMSLGYTTTYAQTVYKMGPKSQMTLNGSSTLHDWVMTAKAFTTNATLVIQNNQLTSITGLSVVLPVINLKSDKDGLNENAWETLEYEDHKNIIFKMSSAKVTPAGNNKYTLSVIGNLTIAGTTKVVTLNAQGVLNADGSLSCSGTLPLKFSQFNIERPSFMLGTMSVGDALTLNYSLVLVK